MDLRVKIGAYKSCEAPALMFLIPEMAEALGISCAETYELARHEGFPALRIGTRIVIPKDELREWSKQNMGSRRFSKKKSYSENELHAICWAAQYTE